MRKILTLTSLLVISACQSGQVQETLGITRNAPNEFAVVSRPPLSLPPEFNLLPPDENARDINDIDASKKAASILLGTQNNADLNAEIPVAESQFLGKLGGMDANPEIRKLINKDKNIPEVDENETGLDAVSKWIGLKEEKPAGKIIDPEEEVKRIYQKSRNNFLKAPKREDVIDAEKSQTKNDNMFLEKLTK